MHHDRPQRHPGADQHAGPGATDAPLDTDVSGARRLMALAVVALIVAAVPMSWAASAVGGG